MCEGFRHNEDDLQICSVIASITCYIHVFTSADRQLLQHLLGSGPVKKLADRMRKQKRSWFWGQFTNDVFTNILQFIYINDVVVTYE